MTESIETNDTNQPDIRIKLDAALTENLASFEQANGITLKNMTKGRRSVILDFAEEHFNRIQSEMPSHLLGSGEDFCAQWSAAATVIDHRIQNLLEFEENKCSLPPLQ